MILFSQRSINFIDDPCRVYGVYISYELYFRHIKYGGLVLVIQRVYELILSHAEAAQGEKRGFKQVAPLIKKKNMLSK